MFPTKAQLKRMKKRPYQLRGIIFSFIAIIVTMIVQIGTQSMVFGALSGIIVLYFSGSVKWNEADAY